MVDQKLNAAPRVGGSRVNARTKPAGGQGGMIAAEATGHAPTEFQRFTDDSNGWEVSPAFVLTASFIFIAIVIVLHVYGKFV